jgi:FeS assembly SUF system protein
MPQDRPTPAQLESRVNEVLKTIYDPEIPVNIFELGLIYEVTADENGYVKIVMTMTSPNCPVAESLPVEVNSKVSALDGVEHAKVEIVWEPPWNPEMMSDAAKLELGMM